MSKKQKIYTTEFKAEAIKAIEENKGNVFRNSTTTRYFHANAIELA